jgi:hypothetical protein
MHFHPSRYNPYDTTWIPSGWFADGLKADVDYYFGGAMMRTTLCIIVCVNPFLTTTLSLCSADVLYAKEQQQMASGTEAGAQPNGA